MSLKEPTVHCIHEAATGTWQYIVSDQNTKQAAIIDPVLDFDAAKNEITTKSADDILSLIGAQGYTVEALLETHLHADHISAASYLQQQLQRIQGFAPKTSIGRGIERMQQRFGDRYGMSFAHFLLLLS
jgi:glyoxylase-like metal-dependent hydrolase (beta-lactamase superfamily II)